ncbi:MAG TPA: SDR family NAD(P)-dependent oxidoreductase [Arthrobacter sp.]|nr:SDR family NAD(P)-dependent oxidoreductase [Arthrobacter sp.]
MPDRALPVAVRTAVISGAARGFGAALSNTLLADGWTVYGIVRPGSPLLGAAARRLEWDISRPCPREVSAALAGARIDVVVNNAAVGSSQSSLPDVDPDALTAALNNNVAGAVRVTQACLRGLLAAGERPHRPLVINMSSRIGSASFQASGRFAGFGTSYSYRLSKAALNMLTLSLHEEFGGQLDVWSVHPGILKTGMGREGADKDPAAAARELLGEIASQMSSGPSAVSGTSPRFLDLGSRRDLPW